MSLAIWYAFVPFRLFFIRHWCRVPLHGGLLLVRCCSYICCWLNTVVLQRVSAAKVVHQVRGINVTSLGGDDGLASFADDIGLTTFRLIISKKNCHTGELTFPLLFTISSFAAALIFCLWKGIQQTSTRQRYGATKPDTVTWLAVSVHSLRC